MNAIELILIRLIFILCFLFSVLLIVIFPVLNARSKVFSIISFSAGLISLTALIYNYIQFTLLRQL
ncbi:hypothetical protein DVH26_19125 [Paenibacillus sp. H1-7]|nr:hypothetical protein DVH26_19125 [Paenibacillus sp. H1-7]